MDKEKFNIAVGLFFREHRKAKKLTYEQVGELVGRNKSWYREVERGRINAKFNDIVNLCEVLEVDINELGKFAYDRSKQ